MKITADRIGRFCWSTYLVVIFPACVMCCLLITLFSRELFIPDTGVIESAPASPIKEAIVISSIAGLPVFWILGVCIGYRFNGRWRPMVPFIAHFIPITILAVEFFPDPQSEDGAGLESVFIYLAVVTTLLVLGLIAVIVAALKSNADRQPEK